MKNLNAEMTFSSLHQILSLIWHSLGPMNASTRRVVGQLLLQAQQRLLLGRKTGRGTGYGYIKSGKTSQGDASKAHRDPGNDLAKAKEITFYYELGSDAKNSECRLAYLLKTALVAV